MTLVCKWDKPSCLLSFPTAEELFSHLCDAHVGRKRHGNLSLNCSWEACDHKAAKRDHMTSHMMVHCPLQTNICGVCRKTFKRSYDLRKHEITHTAAHHEAHARSRATIFNEVEITFQPSPSSGSAASHARVLSCPRDRCVDELMLTPKSTAFRRGNSVPGSRNTSYKSSKPYLRPQSSTPADWTRPVAMATSFAPPSSHEYLIHSSHLPEFTNPYQAHPTDAKKAWPGQAKEGSAAGLALAQGGPPSFNPYVSFGSANPVAYPLADERDSQLLSPSHEEQPVVVEEDVRSGQYGEVEEYGRPAWQQQHGHYPAAPSSDAPVLFQSAGFDWASSSSGAPAGHPDPLGLNDILTQINQMVGNGQAQFNDYFASENPQAFELSSEIFYPLV